MSNQTEFLGLHIPRGMKQHFRVVSSLEGHPTMTPWLVEVLTAAVAQVRSKHGLEPAGYGPEVAKSPSNNQPRKMPVEPLPELEPAPRRGGGKTTPPPPPPPMPENRDDQTQA